MDVDHVKIKIKIIEFKSIQQIIIEFVKLKKKHKKIKNNHSNKFMKQLLNSKELSFDIIQELTDIMKWDYEKKINASSLITFRTHEIKHSPLTKLSKQKLQKQKKNSLESIKINYCKSNINVSNKINCIDPFNLKRIMFGFDGRELN